MLALGRYGVVDARLYSADRVGDAIYSTICATRAGNAQTQLDITKDIIHGGGKYPTSQELIRPKFVENTLMSPQELAKLKKEAAAKGIDGPNPLEQQLN